MYNETQHEYQQSEVPMQRIDSIVSELKSIMDSNGISQNFIINTLDGKCSKNTISTFFKGDKDCKLTTLLLILESCNIDMRFETEKSREAILSGDIAEYRKEAEQLRSDAAKAEEDRDFYKTRYEELIDKNTSMTKIIEKQQGQIEKYMERMENAENALYSANTDIRRKDSMIVDLLKESGRL